MKMSKREKNLLFVVLLLLVIMAYALWIVPIGTQTADLRSENEMLQAKKDEQDMKLTLIPTLEAAVDSKLENLAQMRDTLGPVEEQEEIATYFTELAEGEGLEVTSLQQTRTTQLLEQEKLTQLPMAEVTISARGAIDGFIAVVDTLNQREDMDILSMTQNKGEEGQTEYTLCCLLLMDDK